MKKVKKGFTLIELMIVVSIIGILAAVAIPSYQDYTAKSKFTEVVLQTANVKTAVELCYQEGNALTACGAGSNGVPADVTNPTKYTASVATANGVITATAGTGLGGASGLTYVLTPVANAASNTLEWTSSGTAVPKYAK